MADENKPPPLYQRDVSWDPFPNWTPPSRGSNPGFGLPPFLEPGDLDWIDWAKRRLGSDFTQSLFPPPACSQKRPREAPSGVSEVQTGPETWRISLDVSPFSPGEISVAVQEGFLLISGAHEERQSELRPVSRRFSRKYRLPQGADMQHIGSSLSAHGVLSVEVTTPGTVR